VFEMVYRDTKEKKALQQAIAKEMKAFRAGKTPVA
jgi:hypothetical protein